MPLRTQYEWDKNKAASNATKHGVTFEEAITVLQSTTTLIFADRRHPEERFVAIGFSAMTRVLVVIYCYREKDTVRVISARKATKGEREQYEKGI